MTDQTESAIIRVQKFVNTWRDHDEPAYYARDWGTLEADDLDLVLIAARTRRTDMEIAIDAIITAHPALVVEDSQEADDDYGDLLNALVDAALRGQ